MPRKYDFDLRWQFHNDLLKAYREVAPTCWQQQQAWRRVCESPAPRFYISGHALEEVIRRILYDGMGFLQSMGGNRRRMYEELWVRFSKMVTERPYCNMDMRSVCCILVAQPAPEFYCSPETVRSVFSRMRRKMLSRHVADSHRKPAGAASGGAASGGCSSAQKDLARGIVGVNAKGVVVLERGGCASVAEVTGDEGLSMVSARRSAFRGGASSAGGAVSASMASAGVGTVSGGGAVSAGSDAPDGDGVSDSASVGADEVYAGDAASMARVTLYGVSGESIPDGDGDEAEVYADAAYSDALRLGVAGMHGVDADGGELDVSMS